jgi:DnaJ family protein A protein 2
MLSALIRVTMLLLLLHFSTSSDFFSSFAGGMNSRSGSDDDTYYKVLGSGISRRSTTEEIKKAYRKRAMELHPDKGGDAEQFKSLGEAYEVLSDPQKKAVYDRYGVDGVKGDAGQRAGPAADFAQFFRGFGGFSFPPIVFQLELTLEELFTGKDLDIPLDQDNQRLQVRIEPGMFSGQELMARGKYADPRGFARDIVVRIRELRHSVFQRKNADILVEVKLTLRECLTGFDRTFQLLDGEEVIVRSPVGEMIGAEAVFIVPDKGMPVYNRPKMRGRLFVKTKLELPKGKLPIRGNDLVEFERLLSMLDGSGQKSAAKTKPKKNTSQQAQVKPKSSSSDSKVQTEEEKAILLKHSELKSFGQFGMIEDEEDEDFVQSPFTQYFFR